MIPLPTETLESQEVQLWLASLEVEPPHLRQLEAVLSEGERSRAKRLVRRTDRDRFVAARGLLRFLLAAYVEAPAAELRFVYGPMGQPRLEPGPTDLQFNLSHSRGLLMVGVARGRPVGVDLEPIRPLSHREAIERRVFSERERAALRSLPEERTLGAFFNGWTRKEALAKALGDGLWATLGRVELTLDPDEKARVLALDGSEEAAAAWTLFHLEPAAGFVGAVAVEGRDVWLTVRELSVGEVLAGKLPNGQPLAGDRPGGGCIGGDRPGGAAPAGERAE